MNMNESSPRIGISARDIVTVVFKQKKVFTSIIVFTTALVLIGAYIVPLPHKAEAKIYIDRTKVTSIPGISQYGLQFLQREEILNTEVEVILSKPVAEKVVERLSLDVEAEEKTILASIIEPARDLMVATGLTNEVSPRAAAIHGVQSKIKVKPVPKSNVINISYLGTDPHKITAIVNAVADGYLETRKELSKSKGMHDFYSAQVALFENELADLNKRDQALKNKWSVNKLELERESVEEELLEVRKELLDKKSELASMNSRILDMKAGGRYTPFDNNKISYLVIDQMGTYLLDLEIAKNKMIQTYKPGSSKIIDAEAEISALKADILNSLESIKIEAESKINGYKKKLALLEKKKATLNEQEFILNEIASAIKIAETSYFTYKELEEQARLSDVSNNEGLNVMILSYAVEPEAPIFSRFVFILMGFIFSVFSAYGVALLREYFNHVVDTPEDIEYFSGMQVVAVIPDIGTIATTKTSA